MSLRTTVKTSLKGVVAAACVALIGYVMVTGLATSPTYAVGVLALPALLLAVLYPQGFLIAALALLPFSNNLPVGGVGLEVSASDLFLGLGAAGLIASFLVVRGADAVLTPVRPLAGVLLFYFAALSVTVLVHPGTSGIVTVVQRFELVVVAMLAGSMLAQRGLLWRAMLLLVAAASLLAGATLALAVIQGSASGEFLGIQKNYAGQAIGVALLVVLSHRFVPARAGVVALLVTGLIASLSRGAVGAVAAALLVQALGRPAGRRFRQFGAVLGAVVLALAAYSALPESQQARFVEVTPGQDYGVNARVIYAEHAWATFQSQPLLGIGPGNYVGSTPEITQFTDPHNVLLLEAATGGIVLVGAFLLLNVAMFVVLFRRIRWHPVVLTAIVLQTATLIHGMVDVYWVRGTPVLGWVFVGAALALSARAQDEAAQEQLEPEAVRP